VISAHNDLSNTSGIIANIYDVSGVNHIGDIYDISGFGAIGDISDISVLMIL